MTDNSKNATENLPPRFSRYEIIRRLGRGGMATVYLARDPNFEREVAVKVLPRKALADSRLYQRFLREAQTIASLEHPAIVPVYDFGEENGQPFIVMRYLSGGSLSDRLKAGPLPVEDVVKILKRISGALDAAHAKGIVHRDVKPANILFDQYGEAYLGDFGVARLAETAGVLTGTGAIGTPAYMSPEQIRGGEKIDGRADIYALGIMLFEMLTGRTPFKAETPAQLMMMHLNTPTPSLPKDRSDLSSGINAALIQATAKEPEQRFQNALAFGEAILSAVKGETSRATGRMKADEISETYDILPTQEPLADEESAEAKETDFLEGLRKHWVKIVAGLSFVSIASIAGIILLVFLANSTTPSANNGSSTLLSSTPNFSLLQGTPPGGGIDDERTPTVSSLVELTPTGTSAPLEVSKLKGERFSIAVDDVISSGKPDAGAGTIETIDSVDIYTFEATPGQKAYFEAKSVNTTQMAYPEFTWILLDELQTVIFNETLEENTYDAGVKTLERGGTYTLLVGNISIIDGALVFDDQYGITGTYSFIIWNVPEPDVFNISLGDKIENGKPGPGAGYIETPGSRDMYILEVTPGQTVNITELSSPEFELGIYFEWWMVDEKGNEIFRKWMGIGSPGNFKLDMGGKYAIIVGNDIRPAVGKYSFRLSGV